MRKTTPKVCSSLPRFNLIGARVAAARLEIQNLTESPSHKHNIWHATMNLRVLFYTKFHTHWCIMLRLWPKPQIWPIWEYLELLCPPYITDVGVLCRITVNLSPSCQISRWLVHLNFRNCHRPTHPFHWPEPKLVYAHTVDPVSKNKFDHEFWEILYPPYSRQDELMMYSAVLNFTLFGATYRPCRAKDLNRPMRNLNTGV